jgi:quercetin dioxygenase-like cupin family protein
MNHRSTTRHVTIAAVAVALAATFALPSAAQDAPPAEDPAPPPPPIAVELLTPRSEFTDDVRMQTRLKYAEGGPTHIISTKDASHTVVAKLTVQPGARFPWHTHHGPVVVNVARGSFVYVNADDCVPRPYAAGTAFVDPGHGNVHSAYNPSVSEVTVLYATFYEAPAQGPLTITEGVLPPTGCDLEVAAHHTH